MPNSSKNAGLCAGYVGVVFLYLHAQHMQI
jgi:hypothetical protein